MLQTISVKNRYDDRLSLRIIAIALFTVLTIVSAKFTIEIGPVPITMQVLVVLLSGMVLGARDGAWSQMVYVALIGAGFPFDARGVGAAVFASPTGGFLFGFIAAAYVSGLLVERGQDQFWMRFIAGIVGIAAIYAFGLLYFQALPITRVITDGDPNETVGFARAWQWGAEPFMIIDLVKALIAAGLTESARTFLNRS